MYQFALDPDKHRLLIVLNGFWTMKDFANYEDELVSSSHRAAAMWPDYDVLSDARNFPVQSNEVSAAFCDTGNRLGAEHKRPCAIVVGSMLNKLQAQRMNTNGLIQTFTTMEAAEAWLEEKRAQGQ